MGLPVIMPMPVLMKWAAGKFRPVRVNQQPETPNLPAVWVEKLPVLFDAPPKRRFRIERCPKCPVDDVSGVDEFPWYVQETTWGDDRDDYGRMSTQADALSLVTFMLRGQRYGAE